MSTTLPSPLPLPALPLARLTVAQHRRGLPHTRAAIAGGQLTVGFIGGSITDPRSGTNWPYPVIAWLVATFPGVRIVAENAAIGATGSALGVLRTQRDLIARGCDLVFVEYAVNDQGEQPDRRQRTREGLVRQLLAGAGRDVVLTYTFCQDMYADMLHGKVPASIHELEELGEHYGLGSVWMGLHALRAVQAGRLRWEDWLPDALHPQSRGSQLYGDSVIAFLQQELLDAPSAGGPATGAALPAPRHPRHWQAARVLPFSAVRWEGPFYLRRAAELVWMDQILETAAPGARLSFSFTGRALCLGFDFGKTSADYRFRLDAGEWLPMLRDRPAWCGDTGWYRLDVLADDLPETTHLCELEVIHGDRTECRGTNFRLALIGIV